MSDYATKYRTNLDLVLQGITCHFTEGEKVCVFDKLKRIPIYFHIFLLFCVNQYIMSSRSHLSTEFFFNVYNRLESLEELELESPL